ncbi:hypothetical protein DYB28_004593 [Aphanomyces astaci]|uniref:Ferrochelatase n=1 Tax=Aphanomyces astaci TaxID=112090 RepID=A0A9X8E8I0_APHAT|nr:hypothetical protein DYB28_004593 [Aphanomyces astaci]
MTTTRTAPKVRTAIAMMNMGGPSTLDEVPSFLKNLFSDPEIIPLGPFQEFVSSMVVKRRSPKIQAQYAAIGGGSPIGKWTNHQGNAMCKILDEIRPESAPHKHYTMFRYANPLTEAALTEMKNDGAERAIAFSQVVIMFSAHSVPMKVVYKGDPYTKEIASTSERVMEHLSVTNPHVLSWQSKGSLSLYFGYLPWMGPSTSNVIKGLASQGHKHVLAVPIAFTSDHIETLFEIDIEYAEEARELGIEHFKRSPSLNEEPLLAQAMADLVKDHLDSNTLHSPAYPLNCAGCENPTCRSIVNPIKPYARSRDVACGRPTSQSVHDLE